MNYGVYTSKNLEIAVTELFVLEIYCNDEKNIFGTKLYSGKNEKELIAICERNQIKNQTKYAYKTKNGITVTNDFDVLAKEIGGFFNSEDFNGLKQIDTIKIIPNNTYMPTVAEAGVGNCLKLWRLGNRFNITGNNMIFTMVTNKIEYIFSIKTKDTNIYCGASVNIPYDEGLFGSGQYFRLRNFKDNSPAFCRFNCNLGNDIIIPKFEKKEFECNHCNKTSQGIYWGLKKYTDNDIFLCGCGGDTYVFSREDTKIEKFADESI